MWFLIQVRSMLSVQSDNIWTVLLLILFVIGRYLWEAITSHPDVICVIRFVYLFIYFDAIHGTDGLAELSVVFIFRTITVHDVSILIFPTEKVVRDIIQNSHKHPYACGVCIPSYNRPRDGNFFRRELFIIYAIHY